MTKAKLAQVLAEKIEQYRQRAGKVGFFRRRAIRAEINRLQAQFNQLIVEVAANE